MIFILGAEAVFTAKLVCELSFEVVAFPWEAFNGAVEQTPHSNGLAAVIYTILPKIISEPLTTFPLTLSNIDPISDELKLPAEFVNLIVLPEPVVKLN